MVHTKGLPDKICFPVPSGATPDEQCMSGEEILTQRLKSFKKILDKEESLNTLGIDRKTF